MLKAWQINESEVWAAETLDQAIEACMAQRSCSRSEALGADEDGLRGEYEPHEASPLEFVAVEDDDTGEVNLISIGDMLRSVDEPCLLCDSDCA